MYNLNHIFVFTFVIQIVEYNDFPHIHGVKYIGSVFIFSESTGKVPHKQYSNFH